MKAMTTLGEVSDRIDFMNQFCFDRLVDVPTISFDSLQTMKIEDELHTLRTMAQRSIAWRLGIPFNYLAKCPPELQAEQMNHWIKGERNEQLFVRFDGQEIRAIFTPRYKPVDNFEVLARLDEMGYTLDTQVQCHHDAEFMLLSIPDGKRSFKINGDKMAPGISISNSEVGLASLSVSAFLLRLICTNGLLAKTEISASYRHVSTKILTELPQVFAKVADGLGRQKDRLKLSLESPVADPLASIDSFNRQFALGEREKEAVAWAWPQEAGDTMFHIVNTYTRAAAMEGLPAESLEVWAPVHAWRTLAQLKAEEAVEPLITLLRMFDSDDDDFVGEELPKVFGMIGGKAIPALEKYVVGDSNGLFDRIAALHGLERIASNDPECREQCLSIFDKKLQSFKSNDPTLNGFLVLYLMELNAIESINVIRQAYENEAVDLSVLGDFEDVEIGLGLKTTRVKPSKYSTAIDQLNNDFLTSTQNHPVRAVKIGRNDPCPCGSGMKYKKCCLNKEQQRSDYDDWIKD